MEASTKDTLGLTVRRLFTSPDIDPFDTVEWELRDARIGSGERAVFEQRDVEFPANWSQNATNIVAQKYFRGQLGAPERERSVRQMIARVAGTIAGWGRARAYFASDADADAFEDELTYVLVHQLAAFNSPVWFNVGWHPEGDPKMQASACFILSVEDTMESILEWNTKEGIIFRGGSGSGINLSNDPRLDGAAQPRRHGLGTGVVHARRRRLGRARSSRAASTRRAAKMVVLDVDHPDIREFIWCKAKEEDKAAALRDAGFDMSIDGDGFYSIQYQNANNSVRVTDEFMRAVENDEDWHLIARATGEPIGEPIPARQLMQRDRRGRVALRRPGRAVRHDDQPTGTPARRAGGSTRRTLASPATRACTPRSACCRSPSSSSAARPARSSRVYTHRATAAAAGRLALPQRSRSPSCATASSRSCDCASRTAANFAARPTTASGQRTAATCARRSLTRTDSVLLNDSPTPAEDASWALPVKVGASARSFARGGSVIEQELPDRWSEGLGELTGHLIGDGWLTDVQTGWVYGGDDIEDGLAEAHEGLLRELIGGVSRAARWTTARCSCAPAARPSATSSAVLA